MAGTSHHRLKFSLEADISQTGLLLHNWNTAIIFRLNMTEPKDDWTQDNRRLFGHEYSQYNKIAPEIREAKTFPSWSFEYHGLTKTPPEMMDIPLGQKTGTYGILYDLDTFTITNKGTNLSIDLVRVTPKEWTQKIVAMASPDYSAPEKIDAFKTVQFVDADKRECVVNSLLGPTDQVNTLTKILLWNTLVACFAQQVGNPVSPEGFNLMKDQILKKRQQILDILEGRSTGNLQDEDLWKFGN